MAGREKGMGRKMNILIVDDEILIRRLMRRTLERRGHDVTEAAEAIGGMRLALSGEFDLVLLDNNMPGGEGISIAEAIARSPIAGMTQVVMCTSMSGPIYEERVRRAGALGLLTKPFTLDELERWIEVTESLTLDAPEAIGATA